MGAAENIGETLDAHVGSTSLYKADQGLVDSLVFTLVSRINSNPNAHDLH